MEKKNKEQYWYNSHRKTFNCTKFFLKNNQKSSYQVFAPQRLKYNQEVIKKK